MLSMTDKRKAQMRKFVDESTFEGEHQEYYKMKTFLLECLRFIDKQQAETEILEDQKVKLTTLTEYQRMEIDSLKQQTKPEAKYEACKYFVSYYGICENNLYTPPEVKYCKRFAPKRPTGNSNTCIGCESYDKGQRESQENCESWIERKDAPDKCKYSEIWECDRGCIDCERGKHQCEKASCNQCNKCGSIDEPYTEKTDETQAEKPKCAECECLQELMKTLKNDLDDYKYLYMERKLGSKEDCENCHNEYQSEIDRLKAISVRRKKTLQKRRRRRSAKKSYIFSDKGGGLH